MTLAKLQFSTKEIAAALGISQQTVRVIYRRRKNFIYLKRILSRAGGFDLMLCVNLLVFLNIRSLKRN